MIKGLNDAQAVLCFFKTHESFKCVTPSLQYNFTEETFQPLNDRLLRAVHQFNKFTQPMFGLVINDYTTQATLNHIERYRPLFHCLLFKESLSPT